MKHLCGDGSNLMFMRTTLKHRKNSEVCFFLFKRTKTEEKEKKRAREGEEKKEKLNHSHNALLLQKRKNSKSQRKEREKEEQGENQKKKTRTNLEICRRSISENFSEEEHTSPGTTKTFMCRGRYDITIREWIVSFLHQSEETFKKNREKKRDESKGINEMKRREDERERERDFRGQTDVTQKNSKEKKGGILRWQ